MEHKHSFWDTGPRSKLGDTRVVVKRFWLPRKLEGKWYWLSKHRVVQEYVEYTMYSVDGPHLTNYKWRDEKIFRMPPFIPKAYRCFPT